MDLLAFAYQDNWTEVIGADFMRYAFAGGLLVAVSASLLGYFVVIRRQAFAAHALAHIGFPGATGAVLIGVPVTLGLAVFCVIGALAIGYFAKRLADSEVATGTILAAATGLGVLFSSLSSRNTATVTSVLFGNLLAITPQQLLTFAIFTALLIGAVAAVARPLAFASLNPEVAEAKGVPTRVLSVVFMVLLALVITMAVQVVGTLLLFGLVVTPAATALILTARPVLVVLISMIIGASSVVVGLVCATMFNVPPSFCIVSISFVAWLTVIAVSSEGIGRRRRS